MGSFKEAEEDEELQRVGKERESQLYSFGIFSLVFAALILLIAVYMVSKLLLKRFSSWKYVHAYLDRKLFFSSIIRYMIQAYLIMSHNSLYFLFGSEQATKANEKLWTMFYIGMLILVVGWPTFMTMFLILNKEKLEDK